MTLDHVAIAVRSIAEAERLYVEALGLAVAHREEVPEEGVRTALIPVGPTAIELLEPIGEDSAVGRFLIRRGEGVHHVAFRVSDLGAALAAAEAGGAEAVGKPTHGSRGTRIAFLRPRNGVLIELVEHRKSG